MSSVEKERCSVFLDAMFQFGFLQHLRGFVDDSELKWTDEKDAWLSEQGFSAVQRWAIFLLERFVSIEEVRDLAEPLEASEERRLAFAVTSVWQAWNVRARRIATLDQSSCYGGVMAFRDVVDEFVGVWKRLDMDVRRYLQDATPELVRSAESLKEGYPKLILSMEGKGLHIAGGQTKTHLRTALGTLARNAAYYDEGKEWGFGRRRGAALRAFTNLTGDSISTDKGIERYLDGERLEPSRDLRALIEIWLFLDPDGDGLPEDLPRERFFRRSVFETVPDDEG